MKSIPEKPKRLRGKNLPFKLAFSAFVFFLCVAALEIILRLNHYGNLEIYEPDPQLYWKLKPNQDCFTKVNRQPVHVNAHGTRGPEFTAEKPAGTLRILSLGDSRTFGWGLADGETYSRRLEQLLQKKIGGEKKVEVINAGVNAWSYSQMLVYLRESGAKYEPDFVVLAEANLWTQFSEKNSPEFVRRFMWRVRLKNFLRHFAIYHYVVEVQLQDFYERNRTKFIPVDPKQDQLFKAQQQSDPDAFFRDAIEGVCRVAQTNHIRPVIVFLPAVWDLTATNISSVLAAKRAAAEKFSAPLVDLTDAMRPGGKELYLEADPAHLDAAGNEIAAQKLFECLTNQLPP
jgi:lysophospholipase L1-like esterase